MYCLCPPWSTRSLQLVPRLLSASLHSPVRETWTQCWVSVAFLLPFDVCRICQVYLYPDSVIFPNFYHLVLGFSIFSSSLGWVESRSVRGRPRPSKSVQGWQSAVCCVGYWNVLMQWIITTLYYLAGPCVSFSSSSCWLGTGQWQQCRHTSDNCHHAMGRQSHLLISKRLIDQPWPSQFVWRILRW